MQTALFIIYTIIMILIGASLGLITGFSIALNRQLDSKIKEIKEK